MSGIFRPAFRLQRAVQTPLGVLSGAAAAGGAILPAHVPPANANFVPALRRSVSAAMLAGGPAFATVVVRVTLRPILLDSSNAYFDAVVDAGSGVAAGPFVNASSFEAPRLALRLLPLTVASAASAHAPTVGQAATKGAPLVLGGGAVYSPRVAGAQANEVVGTLGGAGWSPRSAGRRRQATWPNLPKVEPPPWRLTVVTPEVARARARSLMAQRRRAEQARRTREARRKLGHHLEETIDAEIVQTIARFAGEEL